MSTLRAREEALVLLNGGFSLADSPVICVSEGKLLREPLLEDKIGLENIFVAV